jgi:soluble lytic murein transglycosylase
MPDSTVRRFFGEERPTSAVGRLALARVLRDEGDRAGAEREVRAVWQSAELSAELKTIMLEAFRDELTPADHRGRMDRRIGAKDVQHFAGAGCSGKAREQRLFFGVPPWS